MVSKAFIEHPLYVPQPGWTEQKPDDWWASTCEAIRGVLNGFRRQSIVSIGLTGQMHGSVFLGSKNEVLRPCILWNDQRTAKQCERINRLVGRKKLIELTSNPAFTGFTAPKILWLRENEPAVYAKTRKILLPKDYIRFMLTGDYATDVSDASGTLLLNVRRRKWSEEILSALDISMDILPNIYESPELVGEVSKEASDVTGLKPGIPVVAGAGDQASGGIGAGIVKPGLVSATIGTSGVVFAFCDDIRIDPKGRVHTFCHGVPGKWHIMSVMLSAGGSFRWLRDALGQTETQMEKLTGQDAYSYMDAEATTVDPGCEGLIFLPYLNGERTPHGDPYARGVFFGLSLRHSKPHMIRAVLEGITYGMRDGLEIIHEMGVNISKIRISGGGAKSALWRQIQADVYKKRLEMINIDEGPAFGAALLAGTGVGVYRNIVEACEKTIKVVDQIEPIQKNSIIYDKFYEIYHNLYPALKKSFKEDEKIVSSLR